MITKLNDEIIKNKKLEEEVTKLKNQLNMKDNEINNLRSQIQNKNKDNKIFSFNDIMVIHFKSTDSNINWGIKCLATDLFADVEERLNEKFNELRNTNNMFKINSKTILRFKTLSENNIKDGDIIQLYKLE